jgi:hypothetical protein
MKRLNLFILVLVAAILSSCLKTDDQASGTGDVIVVTKKIGNNTVYGISMYAYTFSAFKSITVTTSSDASKTYTLGANQGYKSSFYYEAPDADYSTQPPSAATYTFSAVFENGTSATFQDILSDKVLPVPTIEKLEYDSVKNSLKVTWTKIANADSYALSILDGQKIVFGSNELANSQTSYTINGSASGWASSSPPVTGKTYTIKLFAFLYESGVNTYNVQATALTEASAIWGAATTN